MLFVWFGSIYFLIYKIHKFSVGREGVSTSEQDSITFHPNYLPDAGYYCLVCLDIRYQRWKKERSFNFAVSQTWILPMAGCLLWSSCSTGLLLRGCHWYSFCSLKFFFFYEYTLDCKSIWRVLVKQRSLQGRFMTRCWKIGTMRCGWRILNLKVRILTGYQVW